MLLGAEVSHLRFVPPDFARGEDIIDSLGALGAGASTTSQITKESSGGSSKGSATSSTYANNIIYQNLSPLEQSVLDVMDIYPISATQIAGLLEKKGTSEPVSVILQTLTMMQINGVIESQGSYYIKKL